MDNGGLFITLYDKETLKLYLDRGVYGQHMTPQPEEPSPQSAHYKTLADYASARAGKHVFFFLDREIYYGGQLVGSEEHGAFYINGPMSPLGRAADAPVLWDESARDVYDVAEGPGVFDAGGERGEKCQPFLVQFEDELGLCGRYIVSDQLYFELGEYPYLLPSHDITDTEIRTISPAETDILLDLLENNPKGRIAPASEEPIRLEGEPVPFSPKFGVKELVDARSTIHLEALVLATPRLLPTTLRTDRLTPCRQYPVSPFRPSNVDSVNIGYFTDMVIEEGSLPSRLLHLKEGTVTHKLAEKVRRQTTWLDKTVRGPNFPTVNVLARNITPSALDILTSIEGVNWFGLSED